MTYRNIKQVLQWSIRVIIACLAIYVYLSVCDIWGILALIAFILFIGILIFGLWAAAYGFDAKYGNELERYSRKNRQKSLPQSKENKIPEEEANEVRNVVASISKSKGLYKELIKKSHPDKHPQNREMAEELTQLVNQAKFNYKELLLLKQRIKDELL